LETTGRPVTRVERAGLRCKDIGHANYIYIIRARQPVDSVSIRSGGILRRHDRKGDRSLFPSRASNKRLFLGPMSPFSSNTCRFARRGKIISQTLSSVSNWSTNSSMKVNEYPPGSVQRQSMTIHRKGMKRENTHISITKLATVFQHWFKYLIDAECHPYIYSC